MSIISVMSIASGICCKISQNNKDAGGQTNLAKYWYLIQLCDGLGESLLYLPYLAHLRFFSAKRLKCYDNYFPTHGFEYLWVILGGKFLINGLLDENESNFYGRHILYHN